MTDPNAKIRNKLTRSHRSKREIRTKKFSKNLPCKQGRRSHGGRGGSCPRCPNGAGAARGQQVALFDKNLYLLFILTIKLTSVFKQSSSHLHLKLLYET